MNLINGGVREVTATGDIPIWSKKTLKALCKADPGLVEFYPTSGMGMQWDGRVNRLPKDTMLVVVGPDPHLNRRWYANITRNPDRDEVRVT